MIVCFEIVPSSSDKWLGTQIDSVDFIDTEKIVECPDYVSVQVDHFFKAFLNSKEQVSNAQQKKMLSEMEKADPTCGSFKTMKKQW